MSISVGGLMSGLDTDSIIEQLVTIERRPILQLQSKEADFQLKLSAYGSLRSALSSLDSALNGLDKAEDFTKFSASSANTDIFTVSASSDAITGSFNITVHNLAQVHKLTSTGFEEEESVGEGTLTIQVGAGAEMMVDVADGSTIQDVADAVNAKEGDVTAGVIYDGTHYFLSLTTAKTGEANVIKVTVDDTGDSNHTNDSGLSRLAYEKGVTENLIENQAALDATIDVDGVSGIKRASNTLNDVITGVTIELVNAHDDPDTESTQLSIGRNSAAVVSSVDAFISAYNELVDFFTTNQRFDKTSGTGGPLLGDATAKLIQRRLSAVLNSNSTGMDSVGRLADLGISRDVDGKLKMTTATLTGALKENFNGVVQFFSHTSDGEEGFSVRMRDELDSMLNSINGSITARQKGIQNSIDGIQEDVDRIETRVTASESRIRAQFNALELLLSEYQTTGNYLTQQITSLQNLNTSIANR
ncbi:MAG: flagellar filament capping protein FliD [Desulfobacterales bacterium]|jgi:flagellar hook-associated protein 2|nr:flagellar filament capping protein FliD [Desulfobacterales bacterium]